ncbi:hypothetical protein COP1_044536 [Malus domestica]
MPFWIGTIKSYIPNPFQDESMDGKPISQFWSCESSRAGILLSWRSRPKRDASSSAEGQTKNPLRGVRSCAAVTEQLPWASQSHFWQRMSLLVKERTETASEA